MARVGLGTPGSGRILSAPGPLGRAGAVACFPATRAFGVSCLRRLACPHLPGPPAARGGPHLAGRSHRPAAAQCSRFWCWRTCLCSKGSTPLPSSRLSEDAGAGFCHRRGHLPASAAASACRLAMALPNDLVLLSSLSVRPVNPCGASVRSLIVWVPRREPPRTSNRPNYTGATPVFPVVRCPVGGEQQNGHPERSSLLRTPGGPRSFCLPGPHGKSTDRPAHARYALRYGTPGYVSGRVGPADVLNVASSPALDSEAANALAMPKSPR